MLFTRGVLHQEIIIPHLNVIKSFTDIKSEWFFVTIITCIHRKNVSLSRL